MHCYCVLALLLCIVHGAVDVYPLDPVCWAEAVATCMAALSQSVLGVATDGSGACIGTATEVMRYGHMRGTGIARHVAPHVEACTSNFQARAEAPYLGADRGASRVVVGAGLVGGW